MGAITNGTIHKTGGAHELYTLPLHSGALEVQPPSHVLWASPAAHPHGTIINATVHKTDQFRNHTYIYGLYVSASTDCRYSYYYLVLSAV